MEGALATYIMKSTLVKWYLSFHLLLSTRWLTLDSVVDVLVQVWQVFCDVEEEFHCPQNHTQVGVTKTLVQHILSGE